MIEKKLKNFKGMDYNKLDESTKSRLASFVEKVHKKGLTFKELREMNNREFNKALELKGRFSNAKVSAQRRLLTQTYGSNVRRVESKERAIKNYKNFGYSGKRLDQINRELSQTIGSIFDSISIDIEALLYSKIKTPYIRERKANLKTKELLLIDKTERDNLNQKIKDILGFWSP
jgi:hypothetical protein